MRYENIKVLAAAAGQQLSTYRMLSLVFLTIGCICLGLAIVLFFLFHIANVLTVKLGIRARRTIREIENDNGVRERKKAVKRKKKSVPGEGAIKDNGDSARRWNTSQLDNREDWTMASDLSCGVTMRMEPDSGGTCKLDEDREIKPGRFVIVRDIVMVHTQEVI